MGLVWMTNVETGSGVGDEGLEVGREFINWKGEGVELLAGNKTEFLPGRFLVGKTCWKLNRHELVAKSVDNRHQRRPTDLNLLSLQKAFSSPS